MRLAGARSDIERLLPGADLFVLSSRREGLPMVILEAFACGLPVVATRVGGIPEVVEHGRTGWLVAPEDPEALAEGMAAVLGTPGTGARLGGAARETAEREHSMERVVARYSDLYRSLCRPGAGEGRSDG